MADKKHEQSSFTVTDRRLFNSEGELRADVAEEVQVSKEAPNEVPKETPKVATKTASASVAEETPPQEKAATAAAAPGDAPAQDREIPAPPSSAEQEAQAAAYRQSSKDLDQQVELNGHSAKEFEMTFERFLASLYMTAMLQLGLMRQQGEQPRIDIIGARQTIDTLSLIGEKTKNNLTSVEENFLQNSLYELRMAYVEVTNALTRPPQAGPATGTSGR
jgi:hypothetical protein